MTAQTDAMDALIAAVRDGNETWVHFPRHPKLHGDLLWKAYSGSIDAAVALFGALLPGWSHLLSKYDAQVWHGDFFEVIEAQSTTPARALLLATLVAYRGTLT